MSVGSQQPAILSGSFGDSSICGHGESLPCIGNPPLICSILSCADASRREQRTGTAKRKMKTRVIILIVCLAMGTASPAVADYDPQLRPASPQILGQGGWPVATVSGWDALFVNPAGFASPEGSLTFYTSTFWLYANPFRAFGALVDSSSSALQDFMEDELTSGGFGFGNCDGVGYVGRGFGVGGLISIDAFSWGPDTLTADGDLAVTVAVIAGYAYPFKIRESVVKVGVDLRPMIRILAPLTYDTLVDFMDALKSSANPLDNLNSELALHGTAIGIDLGVIVESGGLRWGLAVRDFLGTRFRYREDTFGDILVSIRETFRRPSGGATVDDHLIPMDISTGFAYDFDFGTSKTVTDLVVYWSLSDIVTAVLEDYPPASILHAGAELELYERWKLRAGFNQGYLTLGTGISVWLLDFNLAFFSRETGELSTSRSNPGMSLEMAFRRDSEWRKKDRRESDTSAREP